MDQQQLPGDRGDFIAQATPVNPNPEPQPQPQPQPQPNYQQQQQQAPQQPQGAAPPPPQYAYAPQPIYVTQQVQMAPAYVAVPQKNMALALVLSFFFGPLGLFYASITGGIVMLILSIVFAIVTLGISIIFTIPACMIWAAIAVNNYNQTLLAHSQAPPPQIIR